MNKQAGFTLIELVVVIVILGILAAFALPKFVDLQVEAKNATVQGLKGSLHGAAALGHGKALASKADPDTTITVQGVSVDLNGTWPAASMSGVAQMIQDLSGFQNDDTCVGGSLTSCIRFYPDQVTAGDCNVEYGFNSTGNAPHVITNTTDCS